MILGEFMYEFKSLSAEWVGLMFTNPGASVTYLFFLSRHAVDISRVMKFAAAELEASLPADTFL